MRIAVLGGGGFLGSHMVERLLGQGHRVRVLSRSLPGLLPQACLEHPASEALAGLLSDGPLLERVLEGCDVVIHLVSSTLPQSSNLDPVADVQTNLVGTLGLLAEARRAGVRRIIYLSSGGTVYGIPRQVPIPETHPTEPLCSYGITKRAIEQFLVLERHLHGLDERVVRLANPYGERQRTSAAQGAVAVFLGKALRGEPIQLWGDGTTVRDFLHVVDATDAVLRLLDYCGEERLFNVGSGTGHSLNEVLATIGRVTGRALQIERGPGRSFDAPSNVLCIERATRELGWRPQIDLEEGIRRFARSLA